MPLHQALQGGAACLHLPPSCPADGAVLPAVQPLGARAHLGPGSRARTLLSRCCRTVPSGWRRAWRPGLHRWPRCRACPAAASRCHATPGPSTGCGPLRKPAGCPKRGGRRGKQNIVPGRIRVDSPAEACARRGPEGQKSTRHGGQLLTTPSEAEACHASQPGGTRFCRGNKTGCPF